MGKYRMLAQSWRLLFDYHSEKIFNNPVTLKMGLAVDCYAFWVELDAIEGFGFVFYCFNLA